ncbi:MAG TPA: M20/M25/M40 family metallo-hydrolase [Gaiellales bacterium]|jgi:succinyl-diaminopimelate desuccinylase|nr:M20/M25/M40 family metallo-hydrolase [Gaiellales bacterium]
MVEADEVALAERLIAFDSSQAEGKLGAAEFVGQWLAANGVEHSVVELNGLPSLVATAGTGARSVIWSSHLDVVPGDPRQFQPRLEGGRLYGRGAYDMKGALAAMLGALGELAADPVADLQVKLLIVPDEESEAAAMEAKATARLADQGHVGEFAICGEPTDLQVGVQAKGALVLTIEVEGRSAHGSTPWLGENAVLNAVELYRRIGELPFARERSELFAGPSVNLGRIRGGDAVNRVPDRCTIDVDVRYLPGQDPGEVLRQVRTLGGSAQIRYHIPAADVHPQQAHVQALREAVRAHRGGAAPGVGRNGASDAAVFLARGVPSVEFGPVGGDHHGPDEHVEVESLRTYRRVLVDFTRALRGIGDT